MRAGDFVDRAIADGDLPRARVALERAEREVHEAEERLFAARLDRGAPLEVWLAAAAHSQTLSARVLDAFVRERNVEGLRKLQWSGSPPGEDRTYVMAQRLCVREVNPRDPSTWALCEALAGERFRSAFDQHVHRVATREEIPGGHRITTEDVVVTEVMNDGSFTKSFRGHTAVELLALAAWRTSSPIGPGAQGMVVRRAALGSEGCTRGRLAGKSRAGLWLSIPRCAGQHGELVSPRVPKDAAFELYARGVDGEEKRAMGHDALAAVRTAVTDAAFEDVPVEVFEAALVEATRRVAAPPSSYALDEIARIEDALIVVRVRAEAEPGVAPEEIVARACERGSDHGCSMMPSGGGSQLAGPRIERALRGACSKGSRSACQRLGWGADRRAALDALGEACTAGSLPACEVGAGPSFGDLDVLVSSRAAADPVLRAVAGMRATACARGSKAVRCPEAKSR